MGPELLVAGTTLQILGNYYANMKQAIAEKESAKFLEQQAQVAELMKFRNMEAVKRKYSTTIGAQKTSYAKGGIDLGSGSASDVSTMTLADSILELDAVAKDNDLQIKLARMRSQTGFNKAEELASNQYNLLQAGTTALGAAAKSGMF